MLKRASALCNICQKFKHTLCALTARNAFAAAFVLSKLHKESGNLDHTVVVVHYNKSAGAYHCTYFFEAVKVHI